MEIMTYDCVLQSGLLFNMFVDLFYHDERNCKHIISFERIGYFRVDITNALYFVARHD